MLYLILNSIPMVVSIRDPDNIGEFLILNFHGGCSPARNASYSDAGGSTVNMYYTYVLFSQKDKQLYIGWTDNLKTRVQKHNREKVEATKYRTPLKVVYYEACINEEDAIKREKSLKTGFGRSYLKRRLTVY